MAKAQNYKVGILFGAQKAPGFDKTFKGIDKSLKAVETGVLAIGTAAVTSSAIAVKAFDEYDQTIDKVLGATGATGEEAEKLEKAIGNVYNAGFGDSMAEVADSASIINQQLKLTDKELEKATMHALDFNAVFGAETKESTLAANSLMDQFGLSTTQAYNLMAQGAQQGLDQNGDLMDVINEYSNQFKALGFDAEDMFGTLYSGAENGTFSVDKLGDAVKEFNIRAKDGSKSSTEAFGALGLNANEITTAFANGGEGAQQAFQEVTTALFNMDDEVLKNQVGVSLFGSMFEDLESDAVKALTETRGEFDKNVQTMEKINDLKLDNPSVHFKAIGRTIKNDLIVPIGEKLTPYVAEFAKTLEDKLPAAREKLDSLLVKAEPAFEWLGTTALPAILTVGEKILGVAEKAVDFTVENWSVIKPMLKGLVSMYAIYKGADAINKTSQAVKGMGKAYGKAKTAIKDHADTYKIAGMYAKDYAKVGVKSIGAGFKKVGGFAKTGGKALASGLGKGFKAVGGLAKAGLGFIASPAGIAVIAVTALIAAGVLLWKNWDKIKEKATQLKVKIEKGIDAVSQKFPFLGSIMKAQFSTIKDVVGGFKTAFEGVIDFVGGVFTGDWERAWEGVKGIFKGIFESFGGLAKAPINTVIGIINGAIQGINGISVDIPDWVPEDLGGGNTIGFSIPEIPMLASGGIATKATLAMVGEGRESEAILPLSKLKQLINVNPSSAQPIVNLYLNVSGGANAAEFESQLPKIKTMITQALKEVENRNKMVSLNY